MKIIKSKYPVTWNIIVFVYVPSGRISSNRIGSRHNYKTCENAKEWLKGD